MEVRFCHNCGGRLKEGAKFCGACGTPVLQRPQEEPVVAPVAADPVPVEEEVVCQEPVAEEAPAEAAQPEQEQPEEVAAAPEETLQEPLEAPVFEPQPEPVFVAHPEPVASVAEPAKPKKDPYPRRGAGRTILAILLCFFIFIWSFAAVLIYNVRSATSGDKLVQNLEGVLEDANLAELPAAQLIPDVEDEEITLVEWAIQEVSDNYDGTVEASQKDIEKFLEESTFSDFILEKLELYVNDLYTGSNEFEISTDEIQELLEDNADLVEEVFDTPLLEEDIEAFVSELEDREILEGLEVNTLKEELEPVYYGIQIGLSYWVIGFFAILALLFIILLALTNKWNMLRTCGDTGITWTVLGCLLCLPALVTMIVPDIWSNLVGGIPLVDSLISTVLTNGLLPSVILLAVGIVLIVVKVVGKKLVLKSAAKKQI